jgi:hypothetical protein
MPVHVNNYRKKIILRWERKREREREREREKVERVN